MLSLKENLAASLWAPTQNEGISTPARDNRACKGPLASAHLVRGRFRGRGRPRHTAELSDEEFVLGDTDAIATLPTAASEEVLESGTEAGH